MAAKMGPPRKVKDARAITLNLPAAQVRRLEAYARRRGVSRSEAARAIFAAALYVAESVPDRTEG